jgi:hypothetical protein
MMKRLPLILVLGWLSWQRAAAAEPTVDEILASVEKKVAPDVSDVGPVSDEAELLMAHQANLRLNKEILTSKDRKLRVIYAITCLNSSIDYLDATGNNERAEIKPDYERMKKFRAILAKEFVVLSKKDAPPQPSK